ncbi:MAG: HAMP domain-containing histidine kinase [Lachnospiraceae bacterium]|nr:HAMP domain-containing histidine kinase [Lachnospiraceae bacterium]
MTKRLFSRYFLSLIGFFIGFLILYLSVIWAGHNLFVWQSDNLLYSLFRRLETLSPLLFLLGLLAGWIIITFVFFSKIVRYLDELAHAAKRLTEPEASPIVLSDTLKELQDELNQVRERAASQARMAREAEQRKNDLIVYLAHDLKTPLTSVIGYLTLLHDEPQISTALQSRYLGIALNKSQRLEDLINEFFDITRFNLTSITLEPEQIHLSRMLEQLASEFSPILAEKELTWTLDIAPDVYVFCDSAKLERVFDNLIRNAINYSYPKSPVFLSLIPVREYVKICVENRGRTIPPEKLERIFDQFFRLDSSRSSSTGGAGLGLAIAKELVERFGGSIRAQSVDERVSFTVLLPLSLRKIS